MSGNEVKCEYCSKVKEKMSFWIGANPNVQDWVMHEGSGKISCPDCNPLGYAEADKIIHGTCDLEQQFEDHEKRPNSERVKESIVVVENYLDLFFGEVLKSGKEFLVLDRDHADFVLDKVLEKEWKQYKAVKNYPEFPIVKMITIGPNADDFEKRRKKGDDTDFDFKDTVKKINAIAKKYGKKVIAEEWDLFEAGDLKEWGPIRVRKAS